jgi:hypothetical protein
MRPRAVLVDTGRLVTNRALPLLQRDPVFYLGRTRSGTVIFADSVPVACPCCATAVGTLRAEGGIAVVWEPLGPEDAP